MAGPYIRQIRRLKAMQAFHRFYLNRGVAVSSIALLLAVIAGVSLSKRGWDKTANLLFETVLMGCVLGPFCFFPESVGSSCMAMPSLWFTTTRSGQEGTQML
jgi:hypothetical protein